MTRSGVARAVGVAVGVAAITFFVISSAAAYGLSRGEEFGLPVALGLAAVVGTIGVARSRAWGGIVVAGSLAVPLVRALMIDALSPMWILILAAGMVVELGVAVALIGRMNGAPSQA